MKIRQISSLGSFALLWAVLPIHAAVQPVSIGAKTDFGTGDFPNSVAVGDFNGDGQLDLATANFLPHSPFILPLAALEDGSLEKKGTLRD